MFARGRFIEAIDGWVDKGGEGCMLAHALVVPGRLVSSVTSATDGDSNGELTGSSAADECSDNKGGSKGVLA